MKEYFVKYRIIYKIPGRFMESEEKQAIIACESCKNKWEAFSQEIKTDQIEVELLEVVKL